MASNKSDDGYERQKDHPITELARYWGLGESPRGKKPPVDRYCLVDQPDDNNHAQACLWKDTDKDRQSPSVSPPQLCLAAVKMYQRCVKTEGDKRHPNCLCLREDFLKYFPSKWASSDPALEEYQNRIDEGTFMRIKHFRGDKEIDVDKLEETDPDKIYWRPF